VLTACQAQCNVGVTDQRMVGGSKIAWEASSHDQVASMVLFACTVLCNAVLDETNTH